MRKHFKFRQGFENSEKDNITLLVKLSLLTDNLDNEDAFRLMFALDKEYRQIVEEKCGGHERKGFRKWQVKFE